MAPREPYARADLISQHHSTSGRPCVTVLDPETANVVVLEPWEHAILILCDGQRNAGRIAGLVVRDDGWPEIDASLVRRTLRALERSGLLDAKPKEKNPERSVRTRTIASLQRAYLEWHKDPRRTGQILRGDENAPFVDPGHLQAGLSPTVALPERASPSHRVGSILVVADAESGLEDPPRRPEVAKKSEKAVAELLREVEREIIAPMPHEVSVDRTQETRSAQFDDAATIEVELAHAESIATLPTSAFGVLPEEDDLDLPLDRLSTSELQHALLHFSRLLAQLPGSRHVQSMVDRLTNAANTRKSTAAPIPEPPAPARQATTTLAAMVRDLVVKGRCPRCLGRLAPKQRICDTCGL